MRDDCYPAPDPRLPCADWAIALSLAYAYASQLDTVQAALSPGGYPLAGARVAACSVAWLFALAPLLLLERVRRWVWLVSAIAFTSLALVDTLYLRYFDAVPPVVALWNGQQALGVRHSVLALWRLQDLGLFAVLGWAAAAAAVLPRRWRVPRGSRWVVSGLLLASVWRLDGVLSRFDSDHPRALATAWNPRYIAASIGLMTYHLVDVVNTARASVAAPVPPAEVRAIAGFLEARHPMSPPMSSPAHPTLNLIVIQVEALQGFVPGQQVEGRPLAPRLAAFARECIDTRLYGQTGDGNTADAEFMTNTGLYPLDHGAAFVREPNNRYEALGQRLARYGYRSVALHANDAAFWNRGMMYPALGFTRFADARAYRQDERVGLGLSDRSFLRQSRRMLATLPRPFHAHLVTLSSHHPYDDLAHYGSFDAGRDEGSQLGNYMHAIHYTDSQLGAFLDGLRQDGLLDSSVVVIYGDHPALAKDQLPALARLVGRPGTGELAWRELQQVPLLIHLPGGRRAQRLTQAAGQIDIMPTTLGLLGISARGSFGRDLLAPGEGQVVLRDGSVIAHGTFYDASERRAYDLASQRAVAAPELARELAQGATSLGYSNEVVKHDLTRQLDAAWAARPPLPLTASR